MRTMVLWTTIKLHVHVHATGFVNTSQYQGNLKTENYTKLGLSKRFIVHVGSFIVEL